MARVKGAMMTRKRRNKILKMAKGYWGSKSKHFKMANQAVMKSGVYAYTGRKLKKRDFRQLWITRINAACKLNGMNYSTFMNGLKGVALINRRVLGELDVNDKRAVSRLQTAAWVRPRQTGCENSRRSDPPGLFCITDQCGAIWLWRCRKASGNHGKAVV